MFIDFKPLGCILSKAREVVMLLSVVTSVGDWWYPYLQEGNDLLDNEG